MADPFFGSTSTEDSNDNGEDEEEDDNDDDALEKLSNPALLRRLRRDVDRMRSELDEAEQLRDWRPQNDATTTTATTTTFGTTMNDIPITTKVPQQPLLQQQQPKKGHVGVHWATELPNVLESAVAKSQGDDAVRHAVHWANIEEQQHPAVLQNEGDEYDNEDDNDEDDDDDEEPFDFAMLGSSSPFSASSSSSSSSPWLAKQQQRQQQQQLDEEEEEEPFRQYESAALEAMFDKQDYDPLDDYHDFSVNATTLQQQHPPNFHPSPYFQQRSAPLEAPPQGQGGSATRSQRPSKENKPTSPSPQRQDPIIAFDGSDFSFLESRPRRTSTPRRGSSYFDASFLKLPEMNDALFTPRKDPKRRLSRNLMEEYPLERETSGVWRYSHRKLPSTLGQRREDEPSSSSSSRILPDEDVLDEMSTASSESFISSSSSASSGSFDFPVQLAGHEEYDHRSAKSRHTPTRHPHPHSHSHSHPQTKEPELLSSLDHHHHNELKSQDVVCSPSVIDWIHLTSPANVKPQVVTMESTLRTSHVLVLQLCGADAGSFRIVAPSSGRIMMKPLATCKVTVSFVGWDTRNETARRKNEWEANLRVRVDGMSGHKDVLLRAYIGTHGIVLITRTASVVDFGHVRATAATTAGGDRATIVRKFILQNNGIRSGFARAILRDREGLNSAAMKQCLSVSPASTVIEPGYHQEFVATLNVSKLTRESRQQLADRWNLHIYIGDQVLRQRLRKNKQRKSGSEAAMNLYRHDRELFAKSMMCLPMRFSATFDSGHSDEDNDDNDNNDNDKQLSWERRGDRANSIAVSPDMLLVGSRDPLPSRWTLYISNLSKRILSFEIIYPGYHLKVSPAFGDLPPESAAPVSVVPVNFATVGGRQEWTSQLIVVGPDGVRVPVPIRVAAATTTNTSSNK